MINDFLISVGLDNKLFKFDLIKNEKVGTYKAKFLISSIKILVPEETDAEVLDLPNRTSKEDQVKIVIASVNGYVEILDFDLQDIHT